MQTPFKWWNKWWDHFFQPQKPKVLEAIQAPASPKQLPVFDLRIQLLGSVKFFAPNREIPEMPSAQHTLLLTYFALRNGQKIRRDEIIDQFWPEVHQTSGRNSLNVALCHIRRHFRKYLQPGQQIIIYHRGCYRLNPEWVIQTDVQRFEKHFQQARQLENNGDTNGAFKNYRKALQLYHGDLLEAFLYEDWAGALRERLKEIHLQALDGYGLLHLQNEEHRQAQHIFQQMLRCDPLLERVHQLLMWCYAKEGQRDLAIRQFRKCKHLLKEEFGIEPSVQTQNLYQQILQGAPLRMALLSRA